MRLPHSRTDFALVLDDYHVIDAKPIDMALTFVLEHLPPQMHLVITTREDPNLPLARLRVRDQLTELRAADLRFTPAEAANFINHTMGLNLSIDDIAALETRTEGWIAGLQLAALSMRGREDVHGFIKAFAGDNQYIVDYLAEEVLQRQSDHVRSFLLQTSILDRLSGPLCDAVTGQKPIGRTSCWRRWNATTCLSPRRMISATGFATITCLPMFSASTYERSSPIGYPLCISGRVRGTAEWFGSGCDPPRAGWPRISSVRRA